MSGGVPITHIDYCPLENKNGEFAWVLLNGGVVSYFQLPLVMGERQG